MKANLLLIAAILAIGGPAPAQTPDIDIAFSIKHERVKAMLPQVCPVLRDQLPPEQQSPWSVDHCLRYAGLQYLRDLWVREGVQANRRGVSGIERQRRLDFEDLPPSPVPSPAP